MTDQLSEDYLPFQFKESATTFDKIMASYIGNGEITLSDKNEAIKKRWISIWTNVLEFHSPAQAIKKHLEIHPGLSKAVAYRDLSNANKLFGNLLKTDKEGRKAVLYEYAFKNYQMAIKERDLQAMNKAWENMYKVSDLDKVEDIHYNPEKLVDKPDKFTLDPRIRDLFLKLSAEGSVDFNKLQADDVEYTETIDE